MSAIDDEREALIKRFDFLRESSVCAPTTRGLLDDAESLLRRQGPITDAQVDAARKAFIRASGLGWIAAPDVRAALDAARDAS